MSVLDSLCTSVGLLWDRLHIIFSDTEQTTGVTSTWMQDLQSLDERAVPAGSLVELIVSLEHARPEAAQPKIRFDVLEFDWLFTGGFDDPVASLKTPVNSQSNSSTSNRIFGWAASGRACSRDTISSTRLPAGTARSSRDWRSCIHVEVTPVVCSVSLKMMWRRSQRRPTDVHSESSTDMADPYARALVGAGNRVARVGVAGGMSPPFGRLGTSV